MCGVALDRIETDADGASRGDRKRLAHGAQTVTIERCRGQMVRREGQSGRGERLPAVRIAGRQLLAPLQRHFGRRLASGMCQLHRNRNRRIAPDALDGVGHGRLRLGVPQRPTSA